MPATQLTKIQARRYPLIERQGNLWIWLGEKATVDPDESVRRILRGRGGYCYHLNGAFSALLYFFS